MEIDFFHIGPQKSGTTWLYRVLKDHPQICAPQTDTLYFFDIHYHRGDKWLQSHFPKKTNHNQLTYEPTMSYLRSPLAPERIYRHNPKAKIVVTLREPIERAFSHYWHEKKKARFNFKFEEVLTNYDLFSNWIEPGLYAAHIERYLQLFPREQLLCQNYDLLKNDPAQFLDELLSFLNVDRNYKHPLLNQRTNASGYSPNILGKLDRKMKRAVKITKLGKALTPAANLVDSLNSKYNMEYLANVSPQTLSELQAIIEPETKRLENLLNINLSNWRCYE